MKNKRGLALEMAISTMLIVFALCMVLLTVAKYMQKNDSDQSLRLKAYAELNQVGEDYYATICSNVNFDTERYGDYNITVSVDKIENAEFHYAVIKHIRLNYELHVTVKVIINDEERQVSRYAWQYH